MTRIAYLLTSAREMTLADGTKHPTGYFAEEALTPYERFTAAGFDVTVITPDGKPPHADPYGLSWFFHYPEEDKDYLASVVRTFAHDVDDIRLTLHQNTELGLAGTRRAAALLRAKGRTPAAAHRIVSAAAKAAWRHDRQFADVLAGDDESGLTRAEIEREINAQRAASQELADERHRRLQQIPGFRARSRCLRSPTQIWVNSTRFSRRVVTGRWLTSPTIPTPGGCWRRCTAGAHRSPRSATARRCCCPRPSAPAASGSSTATG